MTSLLEEEIYSQPQILRALLEREKEHVQQIVADLPPFDYIVIAARGSSDHAAIYAQYAWGANGYPVALATPALHTLYHTPPRFTNALVVGISQSGQSPDIVAVLEEGKRQGRPTLAITNVAGSPLAQVADYVIDLSAGPERSVAATKTYTAQLAVMMLFAAAWSGDTQRLIELEHIPAAVQYVLDQGTEIARLAERYRYMERCIIVGRGYNYATAFELALKLKELTYVMASAYSSADFRHGPIATIEAGMPVVLVMPHGAVYNDMMDLLKELRERQGELLVISDASEALASARTALALPEVPEWLSPLVSIIPGQLLALHLTQAKGYEPDAPRGLQKVTRTL